MRLFAWNLVLALAWMLLTTGFTLGNLLLGFALAYAALWVTQPPEGGTDYFRKVIRVIRFAAWFVAQVVRANLRVAHDVMTPQHHMRPGVVAVPLGTATDLEITVIANLIALTPGTLALDVSTDRRSLYVHAMYIDDLESLRRDLADLERRVLEILR
ncbi:MAG: sodium:proton antiporter [Myxococcales bacterium]